MKFQSLLKQVMIATLLIIGIAGCASTRTQESAGEYFDDTTITAKIKAAFVGDKQVSAANIKVETFKGVVQLSGFANSQAEADRAVQLAREVKSVQSVKNDIRIK